MKRKSSFLLILFLLVFAFLDAQQKNWSFADCLSQALQNNVSLNQAVLSNDLNEINYSQSKAAFFPDMNANDAHTFSFGRSVDPVTYQYTNQNISTNNFSLNATVTLFSGMQNVNTVRENRLIWQEIGRASCRERV